MVFNFVAFFFSLFFHIFSSRLSFPPKNRDSGFVTLHNLHFVCKDRRASVQHVAQRRRAIFRDLTPDMICLKEAAKTVLSVRSAAAGSTHLTGIRGLSSTRVAKNASQPAPPSPGAQNPHAARVAAASSSNPNAGGDARSRLAKLQAQRLEELNRGRGGSGGSGARPNKPEQKWSNRTLIALATSVGACTYLMGTYHGYNAGKAHALEEMAQPEAAITSPLPNMQVAGMRKMENGVGRNDVQAQAQVSSSLLATLSDVLAQLLPIRSGNSIQCEERPVKPTEKCRLAELTQYHCEFRTNNIVCQPIDRIFRM